MYETLGVYPYIFTRSKLKEATNSVKPLNTGRGKEGETERGRKGEAREGKGEAREEKGRERGEIRNWEGGRERERERGGGERFMSQVSVWSTSNGEVGVSANYTLIACVVVEHQRILCDFSWNCLDCGHFERTSWSRQEPCGKNY